MMTDQTDVVIKEIKKNDDESSNGAFPDNYVENLRRVSDKLPIAVWFVIVCEFCERFAFYGVSGPFQNYIQFPQPPPPTNGYEKRQPGAIGAGQQVATTLTLFFQFFCYITPLLGSVIADGYLGRFKTIILFSMIYLVGLLLLVLTSIPLASSLVSLVGIIISMIIIGFGTGGIKSNVGPLAADQYANKKSFVKEIKGERVMVDPKLTIQSIFHWFYLAINLGGLISPIITTYVEKYHSFWLAYLIPLIMFIPAILILVLSKNKLIDNKPSNNNKNHDDEKDDKTIDNNNDNNDSSSILNLFRILRLIIVFRRTNLDDFKSSNLSKLIKNNTADNSSIEEKVEQLKKKYNINWSDKFVDEFRQVLKVCRIFLFFPFYWVSYLQMQNNLISQAATMQVGNVPNDVMNNLNPISLIVFIPFANHILYPTLRRFNIIIRPITRIFIGFILISLSMFYSAVIQHVIYNTGPCYINTLCSIDGLPVPNDISVWWQSPSYILIGFSEVFASITGLNYAYEKAPESLRSTVTALFLTTSAIGSAIGLLIVPFSVDPYLFYMYISLGICSLITGLLLLWFFRKLDKEEENEEKKLDQED